MMSLRCHLVSFGFLIALVTSLLGTPANARFVDTSPTQYLAFQVFTGSPTPNIPIGGDGAHPLLAPPSKAVIKQLVQDIVDRVGSTGDVHHKLAFIIGPLAFDQTDAQLRQMVHDAFEIAVELNVAVGFHIDDSMFWARRSDLWQDAKNVEWLDWEGTPNTGRRIDWGPQPTKFAPQMCVNSPVIEVEVTRLSDQVIGTAIQQEVNKLGAQGHPELFAGVIVGWETQIGQDFDTNQYLGYCALSNRGFSRANPPQNPDAELEKAVQSFIELWANGVKQAGIEPAKIYSHTAFLSQTLFDTKHEAGNSYSEVNHFAPPKVSISPDAAYRPGFSTYPQTGQMEQLYDLFQKHTTPAWASSEGSIVNPATLESPVTTETYLGWMFNHNAALVNIFGWGIGTQDANPFWKAAASAEAIDAYRKFLNGQPLIEATTDLTSNVSGDLPDKISKIQANLPTWIQKHPEQQGKIEQLMNQLNQAIKDGDYQAAVKIADTILNLMGQ